MSERADPLALQGDLTMKEVPEVFNRFRRATISEWPNVIDLSNLKRADSSALALLLELQQQASTKQQSLSFTHPPVSLMTLAELTGALSLLGWTESIKTATGQEA